MLLVNLVRCCVCGLTAGLFFVCLFVILYCRLLVRLVRLLCVFMVAYSWWFCVYWLLAALVFCVGLGLGLLISFCDFVGCCGDVVCLFIVVVGLSACLWVWFVVVLGC